MIVLRRGAALVATTLAFGGAATAAQAAGPAFVDWTSVGGSPAAADGTLADIAVRLSGTGVSASGSVTDGSSPLFNRPYFTPPLASTDAITFNAVSGNSYTLTFNPPVTDPVLHLGSLGSAMHFLPGTQLTRISGDAQFGVSGTDVNGGADPIDNDDANGTVRITGMISTLSFTTTSMFVTDGVYIHAGAVDLNPPETTITSGPAEGATVGATPPVYAFSASQSGSTFECRTDAAAFATCSSPFTVADLPDGAHTFAVRATDPSGNVDPTPATRGYTVQHPVQPPPPPPPAGAAPQNVSAPQIKPAGGGLYTCDPGQWNNVPATGFHYRWQVWYGYNEIVANGQTYRPAPATYGFRTTCVVSVSGPDGNANASSPAVFFTSAGMNALPPAYGDVRVKGIDVYQVVQPNKAAFMFGYPTGRFGVNPTMCGGGTPTNYFVGLRACSTGGKDPQYVNYVGVTQDQYKQATAVVYVDVAGAAAADPGLILPLELSATRGGGTSLGDPQVVYVRNPPRGDTAWVTPDQRDNVSRAAGSYDITLPSAWTAAGGSIRLTARLLFPDGQLGTDAYGTRECDDNTGGVCTKNDTFILNDVPFADAPDLSIASLQLLRMGAAQSGLTDPGTVLAGMRKLYPGGSRMSVSPFQADLDITNATALSLMVTPDPKDATIGTCNGYKAVGMTQRACMQFGVDSVIANWVSQNAARANVGGGVFGSNTILRRWDVAFGVERYGYTETNGKVYNEPGWTPNGRTIATVTRDQPQTVAGAAWFSAVDNARPFTAAAHEFGHVLGFRHAGQDCPGTHQKEAQEGEVWLGDDKGRIQGTTFDYPASGLSVIPEARVDGGPDGASIFDLMSYCAPSGDTLAKPGDAWLSPRNWNHAQSVLNDFATRLGGFTASRLRSAAATRAAGAVTGTAFAVGAAGPLGGRIDRVVPPAPQNAAPASVPDSPYRLRSLDAAGATLLDVGVTLLTSSETGVEGGAFVGQVAPAAASVELVSAGNVLARIARSRPPAVTLTAPSSGTQVRRGTRLDVRWRASDPDGGPLSATVDYSPDGIFWQTVYSGPDAGRASVPAAYLAGSTKGRVRVRINDGFDERSATSPALRVDGTPPRAEILAPTAGAVVRAGDTVLLSGRATDDLRRPLRGRSLTWYAGQQKLGAGARLRRRLPAGVTTLRLVARDRTGRTGVATVRVRVTVPPLRLVSLKAPVKVARGTRSVIVRIRVSAPARISVGGRTTTLGTRTAPVRVTLPAAPAVGIVKVPFTLTPRGRQSTGTVRGTISVVRT